MIYTIGVGIAFFLSAILFSKKSKLFADRVLGAWLALTGIHLLLFFFHNISKPYKYPQLLGFEIPLPFFHSPLLYIYVASLTRQLKKNYSWLIHFVLPFIVFLSILEFLLSPTSNKIAVFTNDGRDHETYMKVLLFVLICSSIFYTYLTLRIIKKHEVNTLNQFSNQEKNDLNWAKYLLAGMATIWASVLFIDNESIIFTNVVLFVVFIGYFGISKAGIFSDNTLGFELNEDDSDLLKKNTKYEKSSLSIETATWIHEEMTTIMAKEKLFKNLDLSLLELATRLGVNPNNLSQTINTFEKKNFFDYINSLRVEEFKKAINLPENQQFTLLHLAFECGFNSKTSFNRNFKKATGLSPTEYLKETKG